MTPKISIAATTGLLEAITDAGGNPDQILRQLGLERSVWAVTRLYDGRIWRRYRKES